MEMHLFEILNELTDVGRALSTEKDHVRLLELILSKAKELTHADGGTLYLTTSDEHLRFEIMLTSSLNLHLGGTSEKQIPLSIKPIPLKLNNGQANDSLVATYALNHKQTININDVYHEKNFDFSGTLAFDQKNHYISKSFLTVPLINHLGEAIGVLQLINAIDSKTKEIIPFTDMDLRIVESFASQAAMTLTKNTLIQEQKALFDALIQLIATTIDEKSPYTAGHCRRVPILTKMIADAACEEQEGPLKHFHLSEDEMYELEVAAWLHDCGKITIPEYVVDKATKLQTIFDKVELINARFEIIKRDIMLQNLEQEQLTKALASLEEDQNFINQCNIGGETISQDAIERIDKIAKLQWRGKDGESHPLLSKEEAECLKISRGTLTEPEREIINNHVVVGNRMLESLPYPKHLKNIPLYASSHHEKIDGSGYPKHLKGNQIPMQARIIAIADIFEALTAGDRPYKKALPLSAALDILEKFKAQGHIDPDLYDVFIKSKLYQKYFDQYLAQ